jgi:hypothetical protein
MRRDEHGRWVPDARKTETTPTTQAAERPPMPDAGQRSFDQHGSDQAGGAASLVVSPDLLAREERLRRHPDGRRWSIGDLDGA